jgi:flagellar biosynthesis protein FliQ
LRHLSQNGVIKHAERTLAVRLLGPCVSREAQVNQGELAVFAREALMILFKLAGPVLLVGLIVGLVISMLQALTQINENTLVFIPKLLAVCATIALLGGFMMQTLGDYARSVFDQIIVIGLGYG